MKKIILVLFAMLLSISIFSQISSTVKITSGTPSTFTVSQSGKSFTLSAGTTTGGVTPTITAGTNVSVNQSGASFTISSSYNGGNLLNAINQNYTVVASSNTLNVSQANYLVVLGTNSITNLSTEQAGTERVLKFDASLTLKNSSNLINQYNSDIVTNIGDIAAFRSEGGGVWRMIYYTQTVSTGTWSPSWTGFSTPPTVSIAKYTLQGDVCTVWLYAGSGTSNSTSKTVTLPFAAADSNIRSIQPITNAGANASGLVSTTSGSNVLTCYATEAGGAWTSSGNATIFLGGFTYIISR